MPFNIDKTEFDNIDEPQPEYINHNITMVHTVIQEQPVEVTPNGNIRPVGPAETVDVCETSIYCSSCGPLHNEPGLLLHDIRYDWVEV